MTLAPNVGSRGVKEPHARRAPALQGVGSFIVEAEIARGAVEPAAAPSLDLGNHIRLAYERSGQADEVAGPLG